MIWCKTLVCLRCADHNIGEVVQVSHNLNPFKTFLLIAYREQQKPNSIVQSFMVSGVGIASLPYI